ncbi:MAG: hypothetical protein CTY16_16045 [Methylobacter sp.]|nr:MAG: hypothetical protein CTY16_16045 [Methylobacter sp.]
MNQELTQRIIGAIVVTALAAIFIPMLFEDPVDNSGQVVSELVIPDEPAITVDDSLSKLPRNADSIAPLPDETAETPEKPDDNLAESENMTPPPMEEEELTGDPMDNEVAGEEAAPADPMGGQEEPDNSVQAPPQTPSLDTGEVGGAKQPIMKAPTPKAGTKPEVARNYKKADPAIVKPGPISKAAPTSTPGKVTKPVAKPAKPVAGLSRWYLQAGSFSKKENALSLSEAIRKQGMPVLLETIQTSKGVLYRLRVGPELDKKRAAAMKNKLDQQNISSILVSE